MEPKIAFTPEPLPEPLCPVSPAYQRHERAFLLSVMMQHAGTYLTTVTRRHWLQLRVPPEEPPPPPETRPLLGLQLAPRLLSLVWLVDCL